MITKKKHHVGFKNWILEDFHKAHEEMWLWIAETDGTKEMYLKQAGYDEIWPLFDCFACEYAYLQKRNNDLTHKRCQYCPIKEWGANNSGNCACMDMEDSPYYLWIQSQNSEERWKHALQLAEMEWIKEEK